MMTFRIANDVFTHFPETKVAIVHVRGKVTRTSKLKSPFSTYLSDFKQQTVEGVMNKGITALNYQDRPVCKSWNNVFQTFEVSQDKASTIQYLLKRAATQGDLVKAGQNQGSKVKADLGKISDIVDLYNCVSIQTETPMGALHKQAIVGDIVLRYGRDGEKFTSLGKTEETYDVTPKHVVYADDKSVLTWLWNFKDSKHACVPDATTEDIDVLVFADQAENNGGDVEQAINQVAERISKIGWKLVDKAILDINHSEWKIANSSQL